MTRLPCLVIPGWVHHVSQRGNNRQAVFYSDNERLVYLALVAEYFPLHGLTLVGYDLMTNHSHLAVIPDSEDSLALGIGRMHNDYSGWHNVQHGRHRHLWQNRFYSCPVEGDREWGVLSYIEDRCLENSIFAHPLWQRPVKPPKKSEIFQA